MTKFLFAKRNVFGGSILALLILMTFMMTTAYFADHITHKSKFTAATFEKDGYLLARSLNSGPFVAGEDIILNITESYAGSEDIKSSISMSVEWNSPDTDIKIFGNTVPEDNAVITISGRDGSASEVIDYEIIDTHSISFDLPKQIVSAGKTAVERDLRFHIPDALVSTGELLFTFDRAIVSPSYGGFYDTYEPEPSLECTAPVGWAASSSESHDGKSLMGFLTEKDANGLHGIEFSLEYDSTASSMQDFTEPAEARWAYYNDKVNQLSFTEGMTTIGDYAFKDFEEVTAITLPDTMRSIGSYAFDNLSLKTLTIPEGVETLEPMSFGHIKELTEITFAASDDKDISFPSAGSETGAFYVDSYVETSILGTNKDVLKYDWAADQRKKGISRLGDASLGATVTLDVDGSAKEFIVVHQGNPDSAFYDASCTGTWLLMKDIYETRAWRSKSDINDYAKSDVHTYLNGDFLNLFDEDIRSMINSAKIPYQKGTGSVDSVAFGSDGLPSKIFLLGGYELGFVSQYIGKFPADGVKLDYFQSGSEENANSLRIAYYNGTASVWWLRTARSGVTTYVLEVTEAGARSVALTSDSSIGLRPALIMPSDALIHSDGSISVSHLIPEKFEVVTSPDKTQYNACESFDPSGMKVMVTYRDGSTKEVTDYTIADGDSLVPGQSSVTVSWTGENGVEYSDSVAITVDGAVFTTNGSGTVTGLTAYGKTLSNIVIPSEIEGESITAIGPQAFYSNNTITSVTISDSIKVIGNAAFQRCENLKSVDLGNGVTTIEGHNFSGIPALTSITIPDSVTSIGNAAFRGCPNLTTILFEHSNTKSLSIGVLAFRVEAWTDTNVIVPDRSSVHAAISGHDWTADCRTVTYRSLGLSVTTPPSKTSYTVRESFDPSDMVITYVGADGSVKDLAASEYTIMNGSELVIGQDHVTISYETGGNSYTVDIAITVTKSTPNAPSAPTAASITSDSITLNSIEGCEYSVDGSNWQDSPIFTGLTPDKTYTFYARYKETSSSYASASSSASIATEKVLLSFTVRQLNGTSLGNKITCYAEKGMTWGEWVNSDYNTLGYAVHDKTSSLGHKVIGYISNQYYINFLVENIAYNTIDIMDADEAIEDGLELYEKQTISL